MLLGGGIVILLLIVGLVLAMTSPLKPVRGFLKEIEAQKKDAALGYVKDSIDQAAKDDINFFIDDWMTAGKPKVEIEKTDAYNKEGEGTAMTFKPTPKYWSHNARVFLTVSFEEFDDPVMFTVERKSGGNGLFSNVFRGWKIVALEYQPIGEEDGAADELQIDDTNTSVESDDAAADAVNTDAADEETDSPADDTTEDVSGDQEDPGTIEQ